MGETTTVDGHVTLSELASTTVRQLLTAAVNETSGRQLHVLAPVLPLLAEAAPQAFLDVIEASLADPDSVVLSLFQEAEDTAILGPSSPHPHLLWALETLCWSEEFLVDAARVLGRLAASEPGGNSGNRPSGSLSTVLTGWVRHTSASLQVRVSAIDAVLNSEETIGWQLLRDLWPQRNGWVMPPASPRFREDWTQVRSGVPMSEWAEFVSRLVDRVLRHAGSQPERLAQMVTMLAPVSPADRDRIIEYLATAANSGSMSAESRALLWEQIETTVSRHRRFGSADWSMTPADLERLSAIADALTPTASPSKYSYLFDWHPDLEGIDATDWENYQERLAHLRAEALKELLKRSTWPDDLASLASKAKAPSQLGWSLENVIEVSDDFLVGWLQGDDAALREVAWHTIERRIRGSGPVYMTSLLTRRDLTGRARVDVLRAVPPVHEYWDALAQSEDASDLETYWTKASIEVVPVPDSHRAIGQLIAHGRAWAAVAVASFALAQHKRDNPDASSKGLDPATVVEVLEAALQQRPGDGELSQMSSHYVGELLDFLVNSHVEDGVVARLEFSFFQLLDHSREPVILSRALASEPELFVELVTRVYRAKGEPAKEQSTRDSQLASHAWAVLRGWTGYPGRNEDGAVDREVLDSWIVKARLLLSESNRADIGDEVIGESFGHSPPGGDGIWPAEPVRDMIERIGSTDLENGLVIGRLNSRGVTTRDVYEGGKKERRLAAQYREWSAATKQRWPRTSRILRSIADDYERDARREDIEAELDADRW